MIVKFLIFTLQISFIIKSIYQTYSFSLRSKKSDQKFYRFIYSSLNINFPYEIVLKDKSWPKNIHTVQYFKLTI
ncbi:hypothetical protein BpHYR1_043674 [Brachionus plicatilis]|uniref:Uncharacterized protein n=1 Tax=Brachionus plicatilis TaxID=10195 RepID=A0A3M7RR19_BRAPC|nr:hypothetical protein BpHYR1_043674 [Brachionus plicatilis]